MQKENKQLMLLLKAHILQEDAYILPDIDWDEVIQTAERQNILAIVCDKLLVDDDPVLHDAEKARDLYLKSMKILYIANKKEERAIHMFKELHNAGIKAVALKGSVVRSLYPVPQWRTMGDIDVLVSPNDMEKAKEIFEQNGYKVIGTVNREIDCMKDKCFPWEIKCTLEAEYRNTYSIKDKIIYNESENWKYGQYKPTRTLLFEHIMIHTSKNLITFGAGVRNLCDIAQCMANFNDIDYISVKQAMLDEEFEKSYDALMNCVRYWFNIDISHTGAKIIEDKKVEDITEYMLSETIYGKLNPDNRLTNWTLRRDDDISPWKKIFFPSLKLMCMPYPYLKKYPFLLPAAWVQRAVNAICVQKIPIKQMVKGAKKSVDYAQEHDKLMEELGLK